MRLKSIVSIGAMMSLAVLAGCSGLQLNGQPAGSGNNAAQAVNRPQGPGADKPLKDYKPLIVRASGYGAQPETSKLSMARKHLMAMRASKLDAYRALAERVYGTVIYGGSSVNDFVLRNDRYHSFVDSYVRGAKVVSVENQKGGVVQTTMQLKLEPRFLACVSSTTERQAARECPIPMPDMDDSAGDIKTKDHKLDSLYYLEP